MTNRKLLVIALTVMAVMVVSVWQGYEIGYRRGMRQTLYRFLTIVSKPAMPYLGLEKSKCEQQAEERVYEEVRDKVDHATAQILRETGKPEMTADDLR